MRNININETIIILDLEPTTERMMENMQQHRLTPAPLDTRSNNAIWEYIAMSDNDEAMQHELLMNKQCTHQPTLNKLNTCLYHQQQLTKEYISLNRYLSTLTHVNPAILAQWLQQLENNYLRISQQWDNMITYYQHHLTEEEKEQMEAINRMQTIPLVKVVKKH